MKNEALFIPTLYPDQTPIKSYRVITKIPLTLTKNLKRKMVEFDFNLVEKNVYLSEQSNRVKYLPKLIWGKNVKYFIFWAKSVNFRKYRDQSVKRQILAEKAEFNFYQ